LRTPKLAFDVRTLVLKRNASVDPDAMRLLGPSLGTTTALGARTRVREKAIMVNRWWWIDDSEESKREFAAERLDPLR
jgi:hypothetical protein